MSDSDISKFYEDESLLAIVVRGSFKRDGIVFFTGPEDSQQLGYMRRPPGYVVQPHFHTPVTREVRLTQEVLFVRTGVCVLKLYGTSNVALHSVELREGDVVLLASGGHGLVMQTTCELLEVKQGPYVGELDKVHIPENP